MFYVVSRQGFQSSPSSPEVADSNLNTQLFGLIGEQWLEVTGLTRKSLCQPPSAFVVLVF